jgi:hypothetical protein
MAEKRGKGMAVVSSFMAATVGAILFFVAAPSPTDTNGYSAFVASLNGSGTSTLLASASSPGLASQNPTGPFSPPAITTDSSSQAIQVAKMLQSLDAKMYGAYWCSHCYDQKQVLGKQAFESYVKYVECSKDGVNSQTKVCRAKEVPGYPTWEIKGQLYPGQQELDELEALVNSLIK